MGAGVASPLGRELLAGSEVPTPVSSFLMISPVLMLTTYSTALPLVLWNPSASVLL